ncbi:DNA/RNA helicase domain-containing protein [Jeotgalicoccus marinus]|uniref:DNA/RNA helicase domain-containing protein n=1 Tax=Jeotgalicoccus marinus TaxID=516700 RepID=UPI0004256717|nr:DNA/RNA helicase domain-containing protein [Jeotgalicoccus marinus]
MHKSFNVDYYKSIYETDNEDVLRSFIKVCDHKYIRKRDDKINHEYQDLYNFLELLSTKLTSEEKNGYFLGYRIDNKIDEEFDLLRFSEKAILNVELKTTYPKNGLEDITDQLKRHKFILSILKKKVYSFMYVASEQVLYNLNEDNVLVETDFDTLAEMIEAEFININELEGIDVNKFIVSPYSNPESFSQHSYYLSQHQRDMKLKIMQSKKQRICIEGEAGTGKSLLLYDIAKELSDKGSKVLMLFCGNLNNHEYLTEVFGFTVKPIKSYQLYIEDFDIVMIDEAQRIYKEQLDSILEYKEKDIYFAFDHRQVLSIEEKARKIFQKYKDNPEFDFYKLKNKIRTNHETIAFIEKVLKTNVKHHEDYDYNNIDISYFNDKELAKDYILSLEKKEYVCIELTEYVTKSSGKVKRKNVRNNSLKIHDVIGREYEKITIIIDKYFYYDEDGYLRSNYSEYYPYLEVEGIYQALTRSKGKVTLVIIKNPEVFIKIQEILTRKIDKESK